MFRIVNITPDSMEVELEGLTPTFILVRNQSVGGVYLETGTDNCPDVNMETVLEVENFAVWAITEYEEVTG